MLAKRRAIMAMRKVSLQYLEDIIVQSEKDLEDARARLFKQSLEAKSA